MAQKKEEKETNWIKWLSELNKDSGKVAGGKGANLAEIYNSKFPVPPAFVITAQAYDYFLEKTGVKEEIKNILEKIDIEDTKQLDDSAKKIREIIINQEMPKDLKDEIIENYDIFGESIIQNISAEAALILKNTKEDVFVAVRSSATTEDLASASFAGEHESFLSIKGKQELIDAVKKCMASLFTARAIYYRIKKGFANQEALLAVIIQRMINSEKSGVIFSRNPVKKSDEIVVEAVYGLGEGIVSGTISPDHYEVSRDLIIKDKKLADKKIAIIRTGQGKNIIVKLTEERSKSQVLTDYEIKRLADYALQLEAHYGKSQDIEFAIESNNLYIVQTRPVTTQAEDKAEEVQGEILLRGLGASPGISSGVVKIINEMKDLEKVRKGDVLVTKMTNPDMVVSMQKASAIITDEGGITSHASIVSREMGIPAVVGTETATSLLKDEMIITVDGGRGLVYAGKGEEKKAEIKPIVETSVEIKVIVDLPDYAERAAKSRAKSVGLTRLEGIIAEGGKHPFYYVKNNKIKDYEELIYKGIKGIARYFDKIWIRSSDIRSDEFKNLQGASKEPELNPMLGDHGIRFSLKHPEILKAEILAVKKAAEETGKKIGIMFPQIISVEEVREAKKIAEGLGIRKGEIEIGVMVETPAACQIIESICQEGIDFISFGTNDLTQFTLALDRGNEHVQNLYNEMHPAILSQIAKVISVCKKYGVKTSVCGQAASRKEMAEFLVKQGIDSLSVNADAAFDISILIFNLEHNKGIIKKVEEEAKEIGEKIGKEIVKDFKKTENFVKKEVNIIEEKIGIKQKKEIHKVNCSNCGLETEVPFVPDGVRPVYCKICLEVKRQEKLKPKEEKAAEKGKIEGQKDEVQEKKEEESKEEKTEDKAEEFPAAEREFDSFAQQIDENKIEIIEEDIKGEKEEDIKEFSVREDRFSEHPKVPNQTQELFDLEEELKDLEEAKENRKKEEEVYKKEETLDIF